jgi:hypothetical protein
MRAAPLQPLLRPPTPADEAPLSKASYSWWAIPEPHARAADTWEQSHHERCRQTESLLRLSMREPHLRGYGSQNGYEDGFYSMLDSVRRSRLVLPTLKDEASGADSTWKRHGRPLVRRMSAKPAPWTLETSIWAGRAAWADSKTFWDTDEVMERRFANDWQILLAYGVRKLVLRFDDGESGSSGDDSADEVEDVRQVLWENDRTVQRIFTLYASACGVIQWITLNAWSEFMDDFRLVSKGSKAMKRSDCDRTFLAVNARGAFVRQRQDKSVAWAATGHDNNKRALNQVEFMLALIHLACNRYIESGELHDVSQALRKLLVHDISPRLTKLFGTLPKRDFRDRFCYVEPVANTLRVHESALRTIFTAIAMGGNGKEAGLLSVERWLAFLRATGQIGVDLSERHALSSFAMSRMCVIDPTHEKGWLRDNSLPFEVRVCVCARAHASHVCVCVCCCAHTCPTSSRRPAPSEPCCAPSIHLPSLLVLPPHIPHPTLTLPG